MKHKRSFCIMDYITEDYTRHYIIQALFRLMNEYRYDKISVTDIAQKAGVGRATFYRYFKSKEDIYLAVVESELDILSDMMKHVVEKDIQPDEKLMEMIYTHLDAVKEVVFRNGTLRANFFRDIWRVEKVRKRFDATETQLFKEVLREGMEKGVFQIDDLDMTAEIVHYSVKGIETPYIRGHIGANLDDAVRDTYVTRLVLGALGKK